MTASSAESLSRKRGSASSDLSSATSLIEARRRTATFIRKSYGGDRASEPAHGRPLAARHRTRDSRESFPKSDHLAGDRDRGTRAEKRDRRCDFLALDVARVRAHGFLVRRGANGSRRERVGPQSVLAALVSD